ncbi:amidohydrolase family protein [Pseudohaliea sp.]|uniref:metal-dependent hydrolase family protein n=1 Tax=Pseudohaliea sp. TaxID=2740289 RepID=UPI0032EB4C44
MNRLSICIAATLLAMNTYAADSYKVIECGSLLDVEREKVLRDQQILVNNDVIEAIGSDVSAPADAVKIDLSEQVCMPGLMDTHVHILIDSTKGTLDSLRITESASELTLFGLRNLWSLLDQGFTTIRIPGDLDKEYSTIALRDAINRGEFQGPRMLVAAHAASAIGGHGDANSHAYDSHVPLPLWIVDGVDEIRRYVRREFKYGSDWIKVHSTGGVMSQHDDPRVAAYTMEELQAFADEAHRHHKKITAHAHGDAGVRAVVEAGFDSVEHATLMEESTVKLMAQKGTVYVPTRYVVDWILDTGLSAGISESNLSKAKQVSEQHKRSIKLAHKHGVKMALGSDPIFPMDQAIREFDAMNKVLEDNWFVLQMGTINSAELLGLQDEIGSLKPGKQADIVAMPKSPLEDMSNIERVNFVMKGGAIVKQP